MPQVNSKPEYRRPKYSWVSLQRGATYHEITYNNAMIASEHKSNLELTNTQYFGSASSIGIRAWLNPLWTVGFNYLIYVVTAMAVWSYIHSEIIAWMFNYAPSDNSCDYLIVPVPQFDDDKWWPGQPPKTLIEQMELQTVHGPICGSKCKIIERIQRIYFERALSPTVKLIGKPYFT